jgi:hypothetical protein
MWMTGSEGIAVIPDWVWRVDCDVEGLGGILVMDQLLLLGNSMKYDLTSILSAGGNTPTAMLPE